MKLFSYLLFLQLLLSQEISAQMKTVIGKTDYPFWLHLPNREVLEAKAPLIIFLHGRSLSGTNINKVRKYGMLYAIDRGKTIPAIVAAPQLASGPWNPDKVLEVIEYTKKKSTWTLQEFMFVA
jgi:poly(3-hydroxybutyrate) depolymerase